MDAEMESRDRTASTNWVRQRSVPQTWRPVRDGRDGSKKDSRRQADEPRGVLSRVIGDGLVGGSLQVELSQAPSGQFAGKEAGGVSPRAAEQCIQEHRRVRYATERDGKCWRE
jgi:hypothetical protein